MDYDKNNKGNQSKEMVDKNGNFVFFVVLQETQLIAFVRFSLNIISNNTI